MRSVSELMIMKVNNRADCCAYPATLRVTMQNMQTTSSTTTNSAELNKIKADLIKLNEELTKSEKNRAEWEALGRVSNALIYQRLVPR